MTTTLNDMGLPQRLEIIHDMIHLATISLDLCVDDFTKQGNYAPLAEAMKLLKEANRNIDKLLREGVRR